MKFQEEIKEEILIDPKLRSWIEININNIESNTKYIKSLLKKDCELMAVIKSDGYGHGAIETALAVLRGGASSLGLASLEEGIELREKAITCPILILGSVYDQKEAEEYIKWNLSPTISSIYQARIFEKAAALENKSINVHIKVNTGMNRLGCEINLLDPLVDFIEDSKLLNATYIYSHLSMADKTFESSDKDFTLEQKNLFDKATYLLKKRKAISYKKHLANSAATLRSKDFHYDLVRVGLAIYGYNPLKKEISRDCLKPAFSVKSRITFIKEIEAGIGVSYGHLFKSTKKTTIAVVCIGYSDGVPRCLSGKIHVIINGKSYPQVGNITMDQMMIDISDNPNLELGTVVTILGKDNKKNIDPIQWAIDSNTIVWEILCGFSKRIKRVII